MRRASDAELIQWMIDLGGCPSWYGAIRGGWPRPPPCSVTTCCSAAVPGRAPRYHCPARSMFSPVPATPARSRVGGGLGPAHQRALPGPHRPRQPFLHQGTPGVVTGLLSRLLADRPGKGVDLP
ncbi:hypothetical protein NKH77_47590 [Streptomyces sp. M19]